MTSWGEPEKFQTDTKEHIDVDCLPPAFADMVKAVSESLMVSTEMVAGAGLGVLSVCCNKHQVCLNNDERFEPLALYMIGVAGAGEKKSPVLNILKKPIDGWVKHKNMQLRPQIVESKQRYKNLKSRLARAERDFDKGKCDEAETIRLAQELDRFEHVKPVRLYSGDTTAEKLTQLLKENDERFSIVSSEGGILQVISGDRYGNGTGNYDVYCQAFNGEPVSYDRMVAGSIVLNAPVLSMVLFIQPVILSDLLANKTLRGVGLIDRCLFFNPESSIGRDRFESPPISPKAQTNYENMIWRLLEEQQRKTIRLSDDARKQFGEWYDRITIDTPLLYGDIPGWASKFRGIVCRIAAILQMCEDGADFISGDNMFKAIVISDYFAEQARMLLQADGLNGTEHAAKYIIDRLKVLKNKTYTNEAGQITLPYRILRQNIHRKDLRQKSDYNEPLQILIDKGWIDLNGNDFNTFSEIYINPALWG